MRQDTGTGVFVVDDGSDPGQTRQIDRVVQESRARYDKINIVLVRRSNSGVAIARNTGIASSNGRYIACLDADDAMHPEFIETCVNALERDRSLGIAYTGLWAITPDGNEGLSKWPGEWQFDRHLKRQNQIPTCCVFRREMWERLGGYRQRYAPMGAGEEDAEFWLRAGAYGYRAKKVDKRGLFIYSHQSGRVSGNREHKVTDWTSWHPWAGPDGDDDHPFASYATPKRHSHPVRAYDEPTVSVVIPVGPGHEKHVFNALDSLEAQTFRGWEAIVVDDTQLDVNVGWPNSLWATYPYARWVDTSGERGAGYARNRGAEIARAPLLLFLDADDWLRPDALEKMLYAWNEYQGIIYSDYTSKAIVDKAFINELQAKNRLHAILAEHQIDGETRYEAAYKSRAFDYDCERAQRQPEQDEKGNFYIWCNVTAIIPLAWHQAVDGFDESLKSWEDVDYHWRLAKSGYCYHRIQEELLIYNFHQGHRRESGRQDYKNLIYYISKKHKEIETVGCRGCGGRRADKVFSRSTAASVQQTKQTASAIDENFVLCWYTHPNLSTHQVTGAAIHDRQFENFKMVRRRDRPPGWSINYGDSRAGQSTEKFLVHRADIAAQPQYFQPIEERQAVAVPEPERAPLRAPEMLTGVIEEPPVKRATYTSGNEVIDVMSDGTTVEKRIVDVQGEPVAPPEPIDIDAIIDRQPAFDLQMIPGIGSVLANALKADGIDSKEKLLELGVDGLKKYGGVGDVKAKVILEAASSE
jgi:glycosyltransferase involved in cell wall biosynthesis